MSERRPQDPPAVVSPTRDDPLARWAGEAIGGPAGRRIAHPSNTWWTATRVLVLVAVLAVGLSLAQKNDCRTRGWTSPFQFVHACYSDIPVTWAVAGGSPAGVLGLGDVPGGIGQPPLATLAGAAVAALAQGIVRLTGDDGSGGRVVLDVSAVLIALAAAAMVVGLVGLTRRRRWDAALAAGSPLLVLSGVVSIDLLGVALGVLALWAWSRSHPVLAGVLLGLGVSSRLHVALVAVALMLVSLRVQRWREVATTVVTAAGTFLVTALLLLAVSGPDVVLQPLRAWSSADAGYGSVWLVVKVAADVGVPGTRPLSATEVTLLSSIGLLAVIVGTALWVVATPRTPRLPAVVLVLVVGSLLVAKAVPVQAALWVLPWAALAVPRWRDHVIWWAVEAAYFVGTWEYLVSLTDANRALPAGYYVVLLASRLAVLAWLARTALVRSWSWPDDPGRDLGLEPVTSSDDDPAAGPFARPGTGAPAGPAPRPAGGPAPHAGVAPAGIR